MPIRTNLPDTDFDNYQPCFFESEVEDEFYDAPAPSEDIWKKFELLPTPPRSPMHESYSSDDNCGLFDDDDFLNQTVLFPELSGLTRIEPDTCCGNLKSKLIQDCMWSGLNSLTATLGIGEAKSSSKSVSNSKIADKKSVCNSGSTKIGNSSSQRLSESNTSIDCVDPSTIFPYPVSSRDSLGVDSPSDSDDDDEEDEDEEEIDVVSIESSKLHMHMKQTGASNSSTTNPSRQSASSMSAQVAAMHNYTQPHYSAPATPNPTSHNHPHNHHSYHCTSLLGQKRSKASSSPASPQPPSKKSKLSISADMRQVVRKLKISRSHGNHRYSSDSEDCSEGGKRAQHNVLERKRRNDLKYSFLRLRDNVPDLSGNDKAAKVVILRKATDYINSLGDKQDLLLDTLEQEKQKNTLLKQKLAKLRNC